MQQTLKSPSGAARAQIIATELLDELHVAMNKAPPAFHDGLRRERLPPLTGDLESSGGLGIRHACAWHTSNKKTNGVEVEIVVVPLGKPEHCLVSTAKASAEVNSVTKGPYNSVAQSQFTLPRKDRVN